MPSINIVLSEDDYNKLQEDYKKMTAALPKRGLSALPPTFEEWLATKAITGHDTAAASGGLDDVRAFNAIEKLITSLRSHDFGLAHLGKHGMSSTISAQQLAENLVRNLNLSQQQMKRIQDLIEYYSKGAKETADLAHVGVTNRAYGALHEAYRELVDRTEKAVDRLGEERAIGRVEGAIAILVNMHVMDRQIAKEKAGAFRLQIHNLKK
jgi:hypothetical protein